MKCLYCGEEIVIGEHSGHWWNSCQACGFGWDFTDEGGVMEMNYCHTDFWDKVPNGCVIDKVGVRGMLKSICRECMRVEKVALNEEGKQVGKPSPWKSGDKEWIDDEALWNKGLVFCPHARMERSFTEAMRKCLRSRAHKAAGNGALVVMEE